MEVFDNNETYEILEEFINFYENFFISEEYEYDPIIFNSYITVIDVKGNSVTIDNITYIESISNYLSSILSDTVSLKLKYIQV